MVCLDYECMVLYCAVHSHVVLLIYALEETLWRKVRRFVTVILYSVQ